jgi:hypothetical protein
VRYFSEGSYTSVLEYCRGVSYSELIGHIWLHFSGLGSISGGAHHPRDILLSMDLYFRLDQTYVVLGSSIFCNFFIPPCILLIYRHIFQTAFPPGGLSRVMLTKNTCVQFHVC